MPWTSSSPVSGGPLRSFPREYRLWRTLPSPDERAPVCVRGRTGGRAGRGGGRGQRDLLGTAYIGEGAVPQRVTKPVEQSCRHLSRFEPQRRWMIAHFLSSHRLYLCVWEMVCTAPQ